MKVVPTRDLELRLGRGVCGVDEVGRGCLAGDVYAAAVILPDDVRHLTGLADSKTLGAAKRAALHRLVLSGCHVGIGFATVAEIESRNILRAALLAMERAVSALPVRPTHALIDGNRVPRELGMPATAVIDGDAKELCIAAASVVAKVTRDAVMASLASRFPGYGWERNAGYGTPDHREAIGRIGVTQYHRASFAGVREHVRPAQGVLQL